MSATFELESLLEFLKETKQLLESNVYDDGDLQLLVPELEERIQALEEILNV